MPARASRGLWSRLLDGGMRELEKPPLQNGCDDGRHTEYQQKDWELLVERIPSLRNADPQVGARDRQPARDKY